MVLRWSSPAYRLITSAPPDSFGGIHSTTGTACVRTDSAGGSSACEQRWKHLILRASIIFVASPPVGKFPAATRPRNAAVGLRRPEEICSKPSKLLWARSEEHTSELQSHSDLVCRLLLEKKKTKKQLR